MLKVSTRRQREAREEQEIRDARAQVLAAAEDTGRARAEVAQRMRERREWEAQHPIRRAAGARGRQVTGRCERCGNRWEYAARRRPLRYCSHACRLSARRASMTGSGGRPGTTHVGAGGYLYLPDGRVSHLVVAEGILGRPLGRYESVSHRNGRKSDNRPDNLEVRNRSRRVRVLLGSDPVRRTVLTRPERHRPVTAVFRHRPVAGCCDGRVIGCTQPTEQLSRERARQRKARAAAKHWPVLPLAEYLR